MATLFGYEIIPPVEPYRDKDETVAKNGALDQVSLGSGTVKYGWRVGLMPDPNGIRRQAAKLDAYREKYGYTERFDFDVPQEWGVVVPPIAVRTHGASNRDALEFEVDSNSDFTIEVGTRFQLTGFEKLYKVTGYRDTTASSGVVEIARARLVSTIPDNTVLDFSPTAKMVFDAEQPIRIAYDSTTPYPAVITVGVREQSR